MWTLRMVKTRFLINCSFSRSTNIDSLSSNLPCSTKEKNRPSIHLTRFFSDCQVSVLVVSFSWQRAQSDLQPSLCQTNQSSAWDDVRDNRQTFLCYNQKLNTFDVNLRESGKKILLRNGHFMYFSIQKQISAFDWTTCPAAIVTEIFR